MANNPPFPLPPFMENLRNMREREAEQAARNPLLAQALETEKREGHRLAVIARTIALTIVMGLLVFVNPRWNVLFYEVILLGFIALGWLQLRMATVGQSRIELFLIALDLGLLTLVLILPIPFLDETIPSVFTYRFDGFIFFFVILSVGTLAYSWRTVWTMGTMIFMFWLVGLAAMSWFGHTIPELTAAAASAFAGHEIVALELDPNSAQPAYRVQEAVVALMVAAILGLKGYRSNRLLIRQAEVAAERQNLSRYFPSSMVDELAASDRDLGAVRSQDVGVLFTDIVGFTEFAETHTPEEVMDFLRDYHAIVEKAIFQNEGTLDKYLGDGVMATFGTPDPKPEDAANSLRAAQQIIEEVGAFNTQRAGEG
jgi:adenylate cyclase